MTKCETKLKQELEDAEEQFTIGRFHIQQKLDKIIDLSFRLARTGVGAFVDPGYRFAFKRKILRKFDELEEEFEETQLQYRAIEALRARLVVSDINSPR